MASNRSPLPAPGDWPAWRRDGHLTAYQPLPGAMKAPPEALARYFLGEEAGVVTPADLSGTGTAQEFLVVARARLFACDAQGRRLWECNPAGYWLQRVEWVADLDGDGRPEVVAQAGHLGGTRWAFLVLDGQTGRLRASFPFNVGQYGCSRFCGAFAPGRPGQQILLVTSGIQASRDGWETNGHVRLLQLDGEALSPLWDFEPEEYQFKYQSTMIADLTGRGQWNAVVVSWCDVWNLDLSTGEVVSHTHWDPQGANGRHYGWNQLVDVFGDGRLDFVVVALTKHVDVLRCDEHGKLSLAWTRGWPDSVTTSTRSLVGPSDPVADLDGDGRKELVVATFDGLADSRWHLLAYDGRTGELRAEALDLVPMAVQALSGDSGEELVFCVRSATWARDAGEGFEIWSLREGGWEQVWVSDGAPFLIAPVPSGERIRADATGVDARRLVTADVDGDGRAEFFTQQQGVAQAWGLDDAGRVVQKRGGPLAPQGPAPPSGTPTQGKMATYLLAADVRGRGRNHLLLYERGSVTELIWEGDRLRPASVFSSLEIPVVCRLLGDERPFLLLAGRGPDRNLFVEARQVRSDGQTGTLWHFTMEDTQGSGQSLQAAYFTVGRFTGGAHLDVFTYSTKPGARAWVLDGRTGHPVWEREEIPDIERHFQPMGGRASVWDYDGDGEDDILFCCPDYYCVVDGRTGDLHVGPVSLRDLTGRWAAYSSPAVLAQEGRPPIVYLGGSYESCVSIQPDGQKGLWSEFLSTDRWRLATDAANGFSEGLLPPTAGRDWRVVQARVDGRLVCFDPATGGHAWEMSLTTAPSSILTGDVDGDGRPEFFFGGQDGNLYVYRDAGDRPEEVWRKGFDGPVGTLLLADMNGDGKSEMVVSVGDGHVVVLG